MRVILAGLILAIVSTTSAAEPARLAVISGPAARTSGLADLLTAELSRADGVELVERDAIRAVADELVLAKALGAAAVADRRTLGTALKADTLVCLGDAPDDNSIRVVVCDTRTGARLGAVVVPAAGNAKSALAPAVVAFVNEVRGRFPGGVTAVVGLSPFACGNLTHEYDHLGRTYADLLADALTAARPGLAVLEVDEARAIAAEQNLAGGEVARFTPAVVDGEYTATRAADGAAVIKVRVRVTAGKGEPIVREQAGVPLADAGPFLRTDAASAVLTAVAGTGGPIPTDRQFALLVTRADRFAKVGAFATSARLREAAVLLKPSAHDQRAKLIDEYQRQTTAFDGNWFPARRRRDTSGNVDADAVARDARLAGPLAVDGRHALGHLEVLVRADAVTLHEALDMYDDIHRMFNRYTQAVGTEAAPTVIAGLCVALHDFVRHAAPKMLTLEDGNPNKASGHSSYARWEWNLIYTIVRRVDRFAYAENGPSGYDSRLTRAHLDDALELIAFLPNTPTYPDGRPVGTSIGELTRLVAIHRDKRDTDTRTNFTSEDAEYVLTALERSPQPNVAGYARLARTWKSWLNGGKTPFQLKVMAAAEEAWVAAHSNGRTSHSLRSHVEQVHREIGLAPTPDRRANVFPQMVTPPRPEFASHVRVNATVRKQSGEIVPFAKTDLALWYDPDVAGRIVRCGDRLDVCLSTASVMLHRTPGRLDEVLADPKAGFADVAWDGAFAWVASRTGGLWAFGPDGELAARVAPGDLPPADRGVLTCGLAPGRVLVVGSFGEHSRGWIAVVERSGGRTNVRLIHEAKRVWSASADAKASADDPAWAFVPVRLTPWPDGTVLIWRQFPTPGSMQTPAKLRMAEQMHVTPLRVDPAAGDVGVHRPPKHFRRPSYDLELPDEYLADGTAVIDGGLFAAAGKKLPNGRTVMRLCPTPDPFLHHGGDWYARSAGHPRRPGSWFRVDPATFRTDWLGHDPSVFNNAPVWASAHFGLVAVLKDDLFRVDVGKLPQTVDDAARGRAYRPQRPIGPTVTRTPGGGFVFACEEGQLIHRRSVQSDEMISYVTHGAYDPSPASTVIRTGVGELVRWPDIRADLGVTPALFERLKPLSSLAFKTPSSTVTRAMERFRAYESAGPADKLAAEQALRAALAEHTAAVRAAEAAVPDNVRALVTPTQYDGIVRLGHGVLYLGGGPGDRE